MLKKFGLAALAAALTGTVALGAAPAIAADMPKKGGTLVMISSQVPRHFNPAVQSGIATMAPGAHLFATLVRSDANWKFHPYLATSWTTSADGKSVTFKLRTDATFHDGKPITSADVKFSIETQKANHPFKTSLGAVSGVETPDAHTVVVKLKNPHPALLLAMSTSIVPIIPKHVYGDGQNPKTHPRNTTNVVGSGAYILKEYKRAQYILLERNPNYFLKGRPYMDRIIYKIIRDSSSRVIAMERGEGNMMPFMSEVASVVRLKKNDKLIVTDKGYAGIGPITWLAFNTKEGPTKDVRVCQAIAYAIDRKFITQQLHRGVSTAATGPIVPGSPFYTKDVEAYEVDLKKAEALLEAAGYPKKADGTRLDLTIDYLPAVPDVQQRIAEYARGQLKKVGIKVTVRNSPDFPTWARRIATWQFQMTMDLPFNWGDPVIGVHRSYLCSNVLKVIWSNTQQYCNPEVDKLLEAAGQETDQAKRRALYVKFQQILAKDLPVYWISVLPYHTAYDRNLGGPPVGIWGVVSPMDDIYWKKQPK